MLTNEARQRLLSSISTALAELHQQSVSSASQHDFDATKPSAKLFGTRVYGEFEVRIVHFLITSIAQARVLMPTATLSQPATMIVGFARLSIHTTNTPLSHIDILFDTHTGGLLAHHFHIATV